MHIRDFLTDPSHDDHLRLLVHLLSRTAYREGFSSLSLEFLGSQRLRDVLAAVDMQERQKSAMYACFGSPDKEQLRALDWYVTGADDDRRFLASASTPSH